MSVEHEIEANVHTKLLTGQRGGFARALGEAWCVADSSNRALLVNTFPDIFRPKVHRRISVAVDFLLEPGHPLADKSDADMAAWLLGHGGPTAMQRVTLLKGEKA